MRPRLVSIRIEFPADDDVRVPIEAPDVLADLKVHYPLSVERIPKDSTPRYVEARNGQAYLAFEVRLIPDCRTGSMRRSLGWSFGKRRSRSRRYDGGRGGRVSPAG